MEPQEWNKLFWNSIYRNFFNSLVTNNLINFTFISIGHEEPYPTDIDLMPTPLVFTAQVVFCMIIEDMTFYVSHRMLHIPAFYPSVHKIHHEHKVSFSLAAQHAHPFEYTFGNILPVVVGPGILGSRMHRASLFGWYFMRSWESIDGHSGYSFSWSPFRVLPC